MGFLPETGKKAPARQAGGLSHALLHRMGCKACPLQSGKGCSHPNMKPSGSKRASVYMLGSHPDDDSDRKGRQFAGEVGALLDMRMPESAENVDVRYNYTVRTKPPKGNPGEVEIECCRPSVISDIEAVAPRAVLGFGNGPLKWATGQSRPEAWAGRRIPVRIGKHACWFFPMLDPAVVLERRRWEPHGPDEYGGDDEFKFALDMRAAFDGLDSLPEPTIVTPEEALAGIELMLDGDLGRLRDYLAEAKEAKLVGFDYETSRLRPYAKGAKILTAALSHAGRTFAFPLDHPGHKWASNAIRARAHDLLIDFIDNAEGIKISHNLAFELEWSGVMYGLDAVRAGRWECSASQAYVLDERSQLTKPDCLSLEFLCLQYFGLNIKAINNLDRKRLEFAPVRDVCQYNGLDARFHRRLFIEQRKLLKREGLQQVYRRHLSRTATCVLTQIKGVPVDQEAVAELDDAFSKQLVELEKSIATSKGALEFRRKLGQPFSVSNSRHMLQYMQKVLRLDVSNADQKSMGTLDDELVKLTLKWREISKQHSTYVKPVLPDSEHVYKGRLHPILSTMKVVTTRTSSEDPNVQNWPKRKNKSVRRQIRGRRNQVVVSFDYAGIQARNVAMESKDATLIEAFFNEYDIHTDWMQRIIKQVPRWFPKAERSDKDKVKFYRNEAKNKLVFPSFFGARPKKISNELRIDIGDAEELHAEFWNEFPDIKGWHEALTEMYYTKGYVTGLTGFRRRAPCTPNMIINAPIQADETAIVLDAMTRLSERDFELQANMEIHDDLTFIWDKREVDRLAPIVIGDMLACPFDWINVPLQVEMSIGDDWATQKEVGVFVSTSKGWRQSKSSGVNYASAL